MLLTLATEGLLFGIELLVELLKNATMRRREVRSLKQKSGAAFYVLPVVFAAIVDLGVREQCLHDFHLEYFVLSENLGYFRVSRILLVYHGVMREGSYLVQGLINFKL